MNRKEIREIKKRIDKELSNFKKVYGCYVNAAGEIVSYIDINILDMDNEEKELYCDIFKKILSGSIGRNLIDIEFATEDVGESDEHKLLQAVRQSHAEDNNMRRLLYNRIIESLKNESMSYVILLAADTYDIPFKGSDELTQTDESDEQFEYFLCGICPVKDSKGALQYMTDEKSFRGISTGSVLSRPLLGFMFPTFDGRSTNIYNALYYTKSHTDEREAFLTTIFKTPHVPMAPELQKNTFSTVLSDTLESECSLDVVRGVFGTLRENLLAHKESHSQEAPEIYVDTISDVLENYGVSEEKADAFRNGCIKSFDDSESLNPSNILETKKFVIKTDEVTISVNPDYAASLKTEEIDGRRYILVPVGTGLEANGVDIKLD